MNHSDNAIRVLTTFAVLVVAAIAAVISFVHIEHLAVTHGQTMLAAMLLPLSIDGTVAAASLVMLRSARMTLPTPMLARVMLVLSVLATLACNVLFGAGFGIVGALLSGWPAVAFIGCAEIGDRDDQAYRRRGRDVQTWPTCPWAVPPVPDDCGRDSDTGRARGRAYPRNRRGHRTVARRARRRAGNHTKRAERKYAADLADGQIPSLRAVMADLRIGQGRAREVRQHLATLAASNGQVSHD